MKYLLVIVLLAGCSRVQRLEDKFDGLEERTVRNQMIQTEAIQSLVDNYLVESQLLKELVDRMIDTEEEALDLDRRLRGVEEIVR